MINLEEDIDNKELSTNILLKLKNCNITKYIHLVCNSKRYLLRMTAHESKSRQGIGPKGLQSIILMLNRKGLKLDMSYEDISEYQKRYSSLTKK